MAKITFVTDDGIYCYNRMPSGLKNVGTDFQEGMNKAFNGLIGKIGQIYVDIIIKLKKKESAHEDLRQVLTRLQWIGMKLNSKKYIFGVPLGKFLVYLASKGGIEPNPAKIKTI